MVLHMLLRDMNDMNSGDFIFDDRPFFNNGGPFSCENLCPDDDIIILGEESSPSKEPYNKSNATTTENSTQISQISDSSFSTSLTSVGDVSSTSDFKKTEHLSQKASEKARKGPRCLCGCEWKYCHYSKISKKTKQETFSHFQTFRTTNEEIIYFFKLMSYIVSRKSTPISQDNSESSGRKFLWFYYMLNQKKERVRICRKAFMRVHGIDLKLLNDVQCILRTSNGNIESIVKPNCTETQPNSQEQKSSSIKAALKDASTQINGEIRELLPFSRKVWNFSLSEPPESEVTSQSLAPERNVQEKQPRLHVSYEGNQVKVQVKDFNGRQGSTITRFEKWKPALTSASPNSRDDNRSGSKLNDLETQPHTINVGEENAQNKTRALEPKVPVDSRDIFQSFPLNSDGNTSTSHKLSQESYVQTMKVVRPLQQAAVMQCGHCNVSVDKCAKCSMVKTCKFQYEEKAPKDSSKIPASTSKDSSKKKLHGPVMPLQLNNNEEDMKPTSAKPSLKADGIYDTNDGSIAVGLQWDMTLSPDDAEISFFEVYVATSTSKNAAWKNTGMVKALPLPMACTLKGFTAGYNYHFIVRAVDVHNRKGPFSDPASVLLK